MAICCLLVCVSGEYSGYAQPAPATISRQGQLTVQPGVDNRFRPRISFYHQTGETIGLDENFTRLSSFVPFGNQTSPWVTFADIQASFLDDGVLGGSFGIGGRYNDEDSDLVYGLSLYYDFRDGNGNGFQQLSPGVEVLGRDWEARANIYVPRLFSDRQALPNQFRDTFLFTNRFQTALTGFDVEMGAAVPALTEISPWGYGGIYHFQGPTRDHIWGVKGRLEASLSDAASLNLTVQNDRLFDTTVGFGVEVRFHGGALLKPRPWKTLGKELLRKGNRTSVENRLAAATRRQSQIVLDQSEETLARDPATGQPLMFLHVAAGGFSSGVFNDPYGSLTDALNDPRYLAGNVDIIYVRGGTQQTILHTGDVMLVDGTTLASAGPMQVLATQTGMQRLPFSGSDEELIGLPIIDGTVTMGNDTTISGFEIRHPESQSAIVASGVNNIRAEGIVAAFSQIAPGISLSNVSGTLTLANNKLTGDAGIGFTSGFTRNGILIQNSSGLTGVINNNDIANSVNDAISIVDSNFTGMITSNDLRGSRNGFAIADSDQNGDTSFSGTISDNRFSGNKIAGLDVFGATVQAETQITLNSFELNQTAAIMIKESNFGADFVNNTIVGPFLGDTVAAEASRIFTVTGGVLSFTPPARDDIDSGYLAFDSNITGDIRDNVISGTGIYGINVELDNESTLTGDITGNRINEAVFAGIFIRGPSSGSGQMIRTNIMSNIVDGSFGTADESDDSFTGISVAAIANPFDGNISGNVTNDHAGVGLELKVASLTGSVTDNESSRNGSVTINGSSGIRIEMPGDFIGDIARNTVTDNGRGITVGDSFNNRLRLFEGDILNNTVNNHTFDAIELFATDGFTGNIRDNMAQNNEKGIFISIGTTDETALAGFINGDVTGNAIENGSGRAITLFATSITSNITGNTSTGNRVLTAFGATDPQGAIAIGATNYTGNVEDNISDGTVGNSVGGIGFDVVNLSGTIRGNTLRNNSGFGLVVDFTGTFTGDISNNTATGNNTSGISVPAATGTFDGDIFGNTTNDNNGGFGVDLNLLAFDGNLRNNKSLRNRQGGIQLKTGSFFGGNIEDNETSDSLTGPGMLVEFGTGGLTGNVQRNTSENNPGHGIRLHGSGPMIGTLQDNITRNNSSGTGLSLVGTGLTGNVVNNQSTGNRGEGILIDVFDNSGLLTGSVTDNMANDNTQAAGILIFANTMLGDILRNTTNGNRPFQNFTGRPTPLGGLALGVGDFTGNVEMNTANANPFNSGIAIEALRSFTGNIQNNTANSNSTGSGIELDLAGTFTGNISTNTTNSNNTGGLTINGVGVTFQGKIAGHTADGNGTGFDLNFSGNSTLTGDPSDNAFLSNNMLLNGTGTGLDFDLTSGSLSGDITGNTVDFSRFSGMDLTLQSFNGNYTSNQILRNGQAFSSFFQPGTRLKITGGSNSSFTVLDNVFTDNNGSTIFALDNQGTGNVTVTDFDRNTADPTSSFDPSFLLENTGGGSLSVTVGSENTGMISGP